MASRVTVTVNVRDGSRAGIAAVRRQIRRMNDEIRRSGSDARFNVVVNPQSLRRTSATIRRLRTQLSNQNITFNTRVNQPNAGNFRRTLLRTLTSPARTSGSVIGGILSDGIGQGIISGMRTAGPVGMAVLAGIILGSLSLIGAALSGLLVTAMGLAFVGIAGVSAATSDEVQRNWAVAAEKMKKHFKEVGEPLIPVLHRAVHRLEDMADRIAPKFKKAMEDAAPATEQFLNKILDGLESFGGAAFQPIMDAWKVFAPVFGEEWDEFMRELGQSFGDMADLVKEHPTEIAAALQIVFEMLELIIDTITFFGTAWAQSMQTAIDVVVFLQKAWADFAIGVVSSMGTILDAAVFGLGWIPGIGPKLKEAQGAFNEWKGQVVAHFEGVKAKADWMSGSLDRANRKRKLEADISQWNGEMGRAKQSLKSTMSAKARKRITADISDLQAKVRAAKVELAMLRDRVVNVTVRNLYDSSLNRHAQGGVVGRAATGGVRANRTLVGEAGPEIVDLAPGSHVRSNPDTRRLMGGGGGGGGGLVQVNLVVDGRILAKAMYDPLRHEIRDNGGNVQDALGQRGK